MRRLCRAAFRAAATASPPSRSAEPLSSCRLGAFAASRPPLPCGFARLGGGRRCSAAGPPHAEPGVVGACVLERMPICFPPPPQWEVDYEAFHYAMRAEHSKTLPKELTDAKVVEESEEKQQWEPASADDAPTDPRSIQRKADQFLYLLVRTQSGWHFPRAAHAAGETIRQVAERALEEAAPGLDTHFIGNAPAAHAADGAGSTIFFVRASFLGGEVAPAPGVTDWAWVTRDEVPEYVSGEEVQAQLAKALM